MDNHVVREFDKAGALLSAPAWRDLIVGFAALSRHSRREPAVVAVKIK
jgi:hypothetical protein